MIVHALYGLKSAGTAFQNHLARLQGHQGMQAGSGNPDLWMRPRTRPEVGFKYFAHMLLYMDATTSLNETGCYFRMKSESIRDPDMYLGCKKRK